MRHSGSSPAQVSPPIDVGSPRDKSMDYNSILPKLWIGSCPHSREEIDRLLQESRAGAILSLVTDQDIDRLSLRWSELEDHCARRGIDLIREPVMDGDSADLRNRLPDCVRLLDRLLVGGQGVYLHCVAGIERAPSVAVAYLHWCLGYRLEKAAEYVKSRRGCSPDLDAIRTATRDRSRRYV